MTEEEQQKVREELDEWSELLSITTTPFFEKFIHRPEKTVALFTGNQWGKNVNIIKQYILRWMGKHPIESKNLRPTTKIRTYRFCSETVPFDPTGEDSNTIYPVLKRLLPAKFILEDVNQRRNTMTIKDFQGGPNFYIEFSSYNQTIQKQAGKQRCIAEGQRVLMADGVWRNIEDLKPGDSLITEAMGGHGTSSRINKIKHVWESGEKEVYEVHCQKGITFECTDDHLIMIPGMGKSEYKQLKHLSIGDYIKCKLHGLALEGSDSIKKEIIILSAIMLGDGWTTRGSFVFACKNEKLIDDIKKIVDIHSDKIKINLCNKANIEKIDQCPNYRIVYTSGSNELREFFKENGLMGKKAGNKFVPDEIFRQSSDSIRTFLRYLFATDGWCTREGVGYCSTSYRLAQDVHFLLRRLGIRSGFYTKPAQKETWNIQYWVVINQSYDVLNFIEQVGIAGKDDGIAKVKKIAYAKNCKRMSSFYDRTFPRKNKKLKEYVKIKSIVPVGIKKVYDITMEAGGWDFDIHRDGRRTVKEIARSKRDNFIIQGGVIVHNCSIYLDENCSRAYMEEQKPRLLASDGDMIIGMTPALGQITWQFEDIYEKARIIIRTPRVVKRIKLRFNETVPEELITGNDSDICVMMAATDDNPAYDLLVKDKNEQDLELIRSGRHHLYKTEADFVPVKKSEYIKGKLDIFDDETEDVRRYGIFRQVAGRIFKEFAPLHVIESSKHFPDGLPHDWLFGRGIDYHQKTPWHTTFIALSPDDEAFVWAESVLSPDSFVTAQIARDIAEKGRDYKFRYNKIDPLAEQTQVNTGLTTIDDLNRIFHELKEQGVGTGGWWSSWDSKSTRGREEVKRRLLNSKMAGVPFNNKGIGPTIWFMSSCRVTIDAIKNWRYEEWSDRSKLEIKEAKETPMQKYSHICTAIECLFKEEGFKGRRPVEYKPRNTARQYGQR